MSDSVLDNISHRRYNPLRGSWVLVSPHRMKRPWQGQEEAPSKTTLPDYDASCYLCPGNKRAAGEANPLYEQPYVFVNDYSAVRDDQEEFTVEDKDGSLESVLLRVEPVTGKCYVITFSPLHNLTLADLSPSAILSIIETWVALYTAHLSPSSPLVANAGPVTMAPVSGHSSTMSTRPNTQSYYMQIFENKGAAMGCSNPHPHGQIWVTSSLPEEPAAELEQLRKYRRQHGGAHMLKDYAELEAKKRERIVFQNDGFIALCPWWAIWPFEVMIIPFRHMRALTDLTPEERGDFAEVLAEVTRRYDNLFETQFPYSMGIHQAPLSGTEEETEASYLHVHFYPPLLRSKTVRKFLVGYEMLGEPQRDITAERAASRLRNCDGELYRNKIQ